MENLTTTPMKLIDRFKGAQAFVVITDKGVSFLANSEEELKSAIESAIADKGFSELLTSALEAG